MKQLRPWHLSALKVISEPMSALARTSERDCRTRTTNENCTANESWTRTKYDYDRFGNRWHQNGPRLSQLGFDANNRITGVTGVGYDLAGNLTSDGSGTGSHRYFYDAENRIIQVDGTLGTCSTATACYVYDAEGRRVRKTTASGTLDFLYDTDGHKVAEVDPTGVFMRGELYASGRHFAVYAPEPGPTGATFFTHSDWLGTERARTDMTGTPCETITSLAFGDGQIISGNCNNSSGDVSPMHFTGKERDSESGLDNFGARYDSSSIGRFMSPDPENAGAVNVDPQSWNGYSYALNNPINNVDPNGLATKVCIDDGNGGQNCSWYANDSDFDKGVANSSGVSAQNGNIYATVDGQQVQVGTYTRDNGAPDISSDFLNLYFAGKAVRGLFSLGRLAVSGVSNLFKGAAEEAADVAIMAKPTPAEAAMIEELRQAGNVVEQLPRTAGKSADLLVNGVKTELKTLVGEGPNTLKNAVETAAKQGEQILVDARGTNMTAEQAANQIARAQGNVGGLSGRVTVLTNNGVVKF
jgi:RHS repeat-associated protein